MKKKKVLHVITVSFVINHFFGEQFCYLGEKTGNEYHLCCTPSNEFLTNATNLNYIPFEVEITRSISPLKDLKAILKIYRYIKQNQIDVVVGHTPKGGLVSMIASSFAGVHNRIYFRHGIIYETASGFKKLILKNIERLTGFFASRVVCVSNSVKDISAKDHLNQLSKNVVLGLGTCNGINTNDKFNPANVDFQLKANLVKKYNLSQSKKVVGYVGRLVKDKGIDDLILAWQIVKNKIPNSKLLLVGPIEERDSISVYSKNQIESDSSIIFTDFVFDSSPYFSLMDVFVLPTYREGFPTVALEASSMNLPVIITKATGCTEAINDGVTGLFISHNPTDIAEKILFYFQNKDVAITHGKAGRDFVIKHFEQTKIWNTIIEKLEI